MLTEPAYAPSTPSAPLQSLLARIPECVEALRRIPHARAWLKALRGESTHVWDLANPADVTNKVLCAALQAQVEGLAVRVATLEAERDELARQYVASRAGEATWTCRHISGDKLFFGNTLGECAKIPLALALQWRSHRPDSLTDTVVRGDEVLFLQGKTVIARVPRGLYSVLPKVLEACRWLVQTASPSQNGSPSPTSPTGLAETR